MPRLHMLRRKVKWDSYHESRLAFGWLAIFPSASSSQLMNVLGYIVCNGHQYHCDCVSPPQPVNTISVSSPNYSGRVSGLNLSMRCQLVGKYIFPDGFRGILAKYFNFRQAFTWDWLMSIPEEIKMCRKRNFTFAIALYFLARWVPHIFYRNHSDTFLELAHSQTVQWSLC